MSTVSVAGWRTLLTKQIDKSTNIESYTIIAIL